MAEQPKTNSTLSQVASVVNLPGYEIKDVLGKGGMAVVYLAIQQSIGRQVALKILVPDHTDDTFTDRFLREARIISNLTHPNIITVFDAGVHQGCHYMSMEYVPGNSLRESRDSLTRKQKLQIIKQIAQALDYAGKKGYVHRDIKPENILIHEDGRAILTDFGIARSQHATQGLTMTGKVIGTPYYMSPEQAKGMQVDHRSDIYGLGVVLFQSLAGYLPYDGPSLVAIGIKHISEPIPELPRGLEIFQPIINTCLSKDPKHRYQTAAELFQALDAIPESELEPLDAPAKQKGKADSDVKKDYNAKTQLSEELPAAPTLQPDQIRTAHISNSRSTKMRKASPSLEIDEVDDFYITETDDYRRLKARKRMFIWLLLIGIIAAAAYYRQQDVIYAWKKYLAPAIENARQEFNKQDSQGESQTGNSTKQVEKSVDAVNQPQNEKRQTQPDPTISSTTQPEDIRLLTTKYLPILEQHPTDQQAKATLTEISNWYTQQITKALQSKDLSYARQLINQANSELPASYRPAGLAELEKTLAVKEKIETHLQTARSYIATNALIVPAGKNALDELQAILGLDPDHAIARQMIQQIADEYFQRAQKFFNNAELSAALQNAELGLTAIHDHAKLGAIRIKIKNEIALRSEIENLLSQAEQQFKAGNIIEPRGLSAVDIYRTVLSKKEKQPAAIQGLRNAEDYIAKQITTTIWENRLGIAEKYLKKALTYFPNSPQLDQASRKLQIARAKSAPRITHILISQYPIVSLLKEQEVITTTPSISIGFSYTNLPKQTTILNFRLESVSENLELINRKLIVSEKNGEHIFSVKHPLATFLPGQYRITMTLDNKTLLRQDFTVSNQSPDKIQLH